VLSSAASVGAHGERAQEGFLRMETVAFSDVSFSADTIQQGQDVTITGQASVLDSWPRMLAEPSVAYVNVEAPGPVMLMKDRLVNGVQAPDAVYVKKGATYAFSMTLTGRRPGHWHVHPTLAIEGAGTLIGPGQWITVQEGAPGQFVNPLALLSGQTINLENYSLAELTLWHWLGFAIGMAWVLYWIVSRPTVTRLAVTSQIALNSDGRDVGLITRKDHRVGNWFAFGTVAMLAAGWIYQQAAYTNTIPQQVVRFEPPALPAEPRLVQVQVMGAAYDPSTSTLSMDVRATNTGNTPIVLEGFNTAGLTFTNTTSPVGHQLAIDDQSAIDANQSRLLHLTLRDRVWADERLIETNKPRMEVAGQLVFHDNNGTRTRVTIASSITPTRF
jgi:methane/ammonia monooxygenase subunit B